MNRTILHCDLNCFYASVELRAHPELQALPVAVCGDPSSRHGIILAKNEAAKARRIQTAETIWQARQKCPELLLLPPHHQEYSRISKAINALYREYTDRVEAFGVDESWLDVTDSLHLFGGDRRALADHLRHRIKEEFSLTISVGVSYNKVFAKLGSDYKKPDATTVIAPQDLHAMVWPMAAGSMLYVGHATQELLKSYGVRTIGDLAKADPVVLEALLGKQGPMLHRYANGLDDEPVMRADDYVPPKSVGNGLTFSENLVADHQLKSALALLADRVASELRHHGLVCRTLQVTVRDNQLRDRVRQKPLSVPTQFSADIAKLSWSILCELRRSALPVRALTVTAQNLAPQEDAFEQTSFFQQPDPAEQQKKQHLAAALDRIRTRYGTDSIRHPLLGGAEIIDPES